MSRLEPARSALQARDLGRTLDVLLDTWRQAPDARLGALIVKVGETAPNTVEKDEWEKMAKRGQAECVSPLLASVKAPSKVMKERVLLLTKWPADPRLDRWVVAQYAQPPFTSTGSGPFWTALKKLTVKLSDPVARATLAQVKSARLEGVTLSPLPPTGTLTSNELGDLTALEAAVDAASSPTKDRGKADELLTAVLENPADLPLRQILMDSLLELGDPRGELLALQLGSRERSAAERKREKALIRDHWAALLGPLAPLLKPESRFANGFLVHAELRAAMNAAVENAIEGARGHRLWRTVESFSGEGSLLDPACFPLLRAVDTYRIKIAALTRFPALESISIPLRADDLPVLTAPGAFPALHSMSLALALPLLAPFERWARERTWRSLRFTTTGENDLPVYCDLLRSPLAQVTQHFEVVMVRGEWSSFHARTRLQVGLVEGKTVVRLKLELSPRSDPRWATKLVNDATAMLEAIARRPALDLELSMGNIEPGPTTAAGHTVQPGALVARVTSLGGRVT
ncbi:MAG: hypothetical protein Q8N26_27715 [Myxococcales bacterium]|nr:hypothetical protein [Myxococcales bacterium]